MRFRSLAFTLALVTLGAFPAFAAAPQDESARGTVLPASFAVEPGAEAARNLDRGAAWSAFRARHGEWSVQWNGATRTPHRAIGRSIPLEGAGDDAGSIESAVRAFIADEPGVFGTAPELERVAATRAGSVWYLRFHQNVNGLPVLFADWEFRVGASRRLIAFGADALANAVIEDGSAPRIGAGVARAAATLGIDFDPATDTAQGGETRALMPVRTETGLVLREVLEVTVRTASPPGNWVALVDAVTGEVRFRLNHVRTAISGTVDGSVHPLLPTDTPVASPFRYESVSVGPATTTTNGSGSYSAAATGTVTVSTQLSGLWCNVNRQDGADAVQSAGATNPATVNFSWSDATSQISERDAYFHVNVVHDYVKSLDPAFTGVDYAMPCAVNINATCNAYWDGTGVNFYRAGSPCPNTATMPDVVYHEYGHAINDKLYISQGAPFGMINGALHEGTADINAALLLDNPQVGRGFFGPGTHLRDLANTNRWPQDDGEIHYAGQIIGGAFWDLRQSVGLAIARHLAHFAKYGIPDDNDNGVAMHEFFVETLVADDDDADLSNGTPHSSQIVAAFNAHGIGTGFFIQITHAPLADTPSHGPYYVAATIQYTGPFGSLDTASPRVHYTINGGPEQSVAMTPTGAPNTFGASIPPQFTGIVRYWLTAFDSFGQGFAEPVAAPLRGVHLFLAGPFSELLSQNMETNPGWTVGGPDDNAATGQWVRADPVGAYVDTEVSQPEDDHTPSGTFCWITGNAGVGQPAGTADVDGGQTTLTTSAFDATAGGATNPLVEFYRWYRNDLGGAPQSDTLHVQISNNGGASWVTVEDVLTSSGVWVRDLFPIADFIAPTANMKLRFRAADFGGGSLVEAGVDDFRLLGIPGTLDAPTVAVAGAGLWLAAAPNPFGARTTLEFTLPRGGDTSLDVYDAVGRRVRSIARGRFEAGAHVASWDGRDDAGRALGAGAYWLRLGFEGRDVTRRVMRVR